MATKTFKIGLSDADKAAMAQDIYEQVIALEFNEYDSAETYNTGDFVVYNDTLYVCTANNVTGTWDSSKWTAATVQDAFQSELSNYYTKAETESKIDEMAVIRGEQKSISKVMLNDELLNNLEYLYNNVFKKVDNVEISGLSTTISKGYVFKQGEYYCITITASDVDNNLQFGTTATSNGAGGYIDSSDLYTAEDLTDYKFIFKASGDASYFYLYSNSTSASISVKVERLILPINKKIGREATATLNSSFPTLPFHFEKGKTYEVTVSSISNTQVVQLWNGFKPTGPYYDSSMVISGWNATNYKWIFTAEEEGTCLYMYGANNHTVKVSEFLEAEPKEKVNNSVIVSSFDGTLSGSDVTATAWTQQTGYITITHSGGESTWFTDGCVSDKYVTAYDRKLIYDFVLHTNCLPAFYTAPANLETFFAQGWCIHMNLSANAIVVSQNYGGSSTLPSNFAGFTVPGLSNYVDKKLRAVISRNNVRGINFKLYDGTTFDLICEIDTPYSSSIVPEYGLGYDRQAICSLQGQLDLYAMKEIIPNADKTFMYIVGDSITEGVGVKPENAYAYMVAAKIPNTIVSGRGGGNILGVTEKIDTEAALLKPKYVMVTIGTNGGNNTERLETLISKIEAIGAIPIINTIPCSTDAGVNYTSINNQILALDVKHVRMDIATALNYDLNDGPDSSLFVSDGIHPNEDGHKRMYEAVLQQLPELFN